MSVSMATSRPLNSNNIKNRNRSASVDASSRNAKFAKAEQQQIEEEFEKM